MKVGGAPLFCSPCEIGEKNLSTTKLYDAFTAPFDDDQISKVTKKGKRFSNVAPVFYVEKLSAAHPLGYSVSEGAHSVLHNSVIVPVTVTLYIDNDARVSTANGTAPLVDENGNELDAGDVVKSAASDGLKRALMKWGVGTHLYHDEAESVGSGDNAAPAKSSTVKQPSKPIPQDDEEEEEAAPAKRKTTPAKGGSDWGSKREKFTVPVGKHKGTTYADVDAGWLVWATEKIDDNDRNAKLLECVNNEIKFRKAEGSFNPNAGKKSNKPTVKRNIGEDDDNDF